MQFGKVAIALGALVIIGLLIFATVSNIIPNMFTFFTCVFKAFLTPGGAEDKITTCVNAIEFKFRNTP